MRAFAFTLSFDVLAVTFAVALAFAIASMSIEHNDNTRVESGEEIEEETRCELQGGEKKKGIHAKGGGKRAAIVDLIGKTRKG